MLPSNRSDQPIESWRDVALEPNMKPAGIICLSIDKPNEDSRRRLDSRDWDRDGRRWRSISDVLTGAGLCLFMVFIIHWYLLLGHT